METRVARLSSTQESLKEQQVREIQRPRPGTVGAHTHPQRLVPDRVLVLDGYSNPALACVRSLGRAGYTVFVASHRRWPLAAWSRYCAGTCWHAEETLQGFATARAWAHAHGVRIVLPLTELACQLCNAERGQWEALDMIVGCAPEPLALRAFDKGATLRLAEACGVEIPLTRYPASLDECRAAADAIGYPCIVKPRFTAAWNGLGFVPDPGLCYVASAAGLDHAVLTRRQGTHWPVIQRFVPGQGKGVFTVCDHGRPIAWFAHERLRDIRPSGSGSSLRRSVAVDPRLRSRAERLLEAMRWHGPAMVEFRDDGVHPPWLMEVNGRFWGSLQLAIDAGCDFPRLWVDLLAGKVVDAPRAYRDGVTVRWLWGDVKRFLYIVAGPPRGYPGAYPSVARGLQELFGRQPPGTRLEVWDRRDKWPAVAEWVEGVRDVLIQALKRR